MTDARVERGTCRFIAKNDESGRPIVVLEVFHGTVSVLNHATLSFNLLGGLTIERARKMAESLNENILDASVLVSSEHPMFAPRRV
jgi:hypothetical protein